jgi:hypothetical protein
VDSLPHSPSAPVHRSRSATLPGSCSPSRRSRRCCPGDHLPLFVEPSLQESLSSFSCHGVLQMHPLLLTTTSVTRVAVGEPPPLRTLPPPLGASPSSRLCQESTPWAMGPCRELVIIGRLLVSPGRPRQATCSGHAVAPSTSSRVPMGRSWLVGHAQAGHAQRSICAQAGQFTVCLGHACPIGEIEFISFCSELQKS